MIKSAKDLTEPKQLILVHCAAGGRASLAAARLVEMGYSNVYAITEKFNDIKDKLGSRAR